MVGRIIPNPLQKGNVISWSRDTPGKARGIVRVAETSDYATPIDYAFKALHVRRLPRDACLYSQLISGKYSQVYRDSQPYIAVGLPVTFQMRDSGVTRIAIDFSRLMQGVIDR